MFDAVGPKPFKFFIKPAADGVDPVLAPWRSVIQGTPTASRWPQIWTDYFVQNGNIDFKNWIKSLNSTQSQQLRNYVSAWSDQSTFQALISLGATQWAEIAQDIQRAKAFGFLKAANNSKFDKIHYWNEMINDLAKYPGLEAKMLANTENTILWEKLSNNFTELGLPDAAKIEQLETADFIKQLWLRDNKIAFNANDIRVVNNGEVSIAQFNSNGTLNIDVTPSPGGASTEIVATSNKGKRAINCVTGDCGFGPNCFPAGTKVHTPSGLRNIEEIQEGDYVIAYDTEEKDTVYSRILKPVNKLSTAMCRIVAGLDTITSTKEHKFYLPDFKKYLRADSLKTGMNILTLAGTLAVINNVAAFDAPQQVYNFEVENQHNYFVGENGILVHNDCNLTAARISQANFENAFPDPVSAASREQWATELNLALGAFDEANPSPLYNFFSRNLDGLDEATKNTLIEARLRAWKAVDGDMTLIQRFDGLTDQIQPLISKYSLGTLKDFLDDIGNNPQLLNYVNDVENVSAVKSMVIHKGVNMTDEELDIAFEKYDQLDDQLVLDQRIKHWINRSEGHVQRQARFDLGNGFESSYRLGLSNNVFGAETAEYLALKARFAAQDIDKILDEYTIMSNVQLCMVQPCSQKGNYFIPDFIAVKEEIGIDGLPYWDVVIIDTKLNQFTTPWTGNQIAAQGVPDYWVKSIGENSYVTGPVSPAFLTLENSVIKIIKGNTPFVRVYSDGIGNFAGID